MTVRLYAKPGCALCDKARDWLEDMGVRRHEVNILKDEAAYRRFKDLIPVVEAGGQILTPPFTKRRLRSWLKGVQAPSPAAAQGSPAQTSLAE